MLVVCVWCIECLLCNQSLYTIYLCCCCCCCQDPWIQNATLRDNILMGLPYDEQRYADTVRVCCLEKDLQVIGWAAHRGAMEGEGGGAGAWLMWQQHEERGGGGVTSCTVSSLPTMY
jgi:hypothetical protein